MTGQGQYILAVIEHATRRVRVLGVGHRTSHRGLGDSGGGEPGDGTGQRGHQVRYLIRDRDAKFPAPVDRILNDSGIDIVPTGVPMPRMNSIMERWVRSCSRELIDRKLVWNESHLRQFELHSNEHRPHQTMHQAAPLRAVPAPITDPERLARLDIRRSDRLGGIIHEYRHAA